MTDVLLILTGYLLGSMPWGYWLPRLLKGVNIRKEGSGSTGAANVWRTAGFKIALGVALLDVAKGFAAALLGLWLGGELVGLLAGFDLLTLSQQLQERRPGSHHWHIIAERRG